MVHKVKHELYINDDQGDMNLHSFVFGRLEKKHCEFEGLIVPSPFEFLIGYGL